MITFFQGFSVSVAGNPNGAILQTVNAPDMMTMQDP